MKTAIDYWFSIEPYVFVGMTNKCALLYNTLDGVTIESDKEEVIELLQETFQVENCGVVLLTNERYKQKHVNGFIRVLREKYMGDVIDVTLSKSKPIQLSPYFNFPNKHEIYKRHNFTPFKNVLEYLSEISIYVNATTNLTKLVPFLQSIPGGPTFNIIGNMRKIANYCLFLINIHPRKIYCVLIKM